jgi:hypothetical protein
VHQGEHAKEAVMEERDDWQQTEPGSLAADVVYEIVEAEPYYEVPSAVDEQASRRGTMAVDQTYPQLTPAPRPQGEWQSPVEWQIDDRPTAAAEFPITGEVTPAPPVVERKDGEEQSAPVTLARDTLIVPAEVTAAPRVDEPPTRQRGRGTLARDT